MHELAQHLLDQVQDQELQHFWIQLDQLIRSLAKLLTTAMQVPASDLPVIALTKYRTYYLA